MAERKTYREMLLDPRWQRKRLKILEAAEWKCSVCGAADRTLHVHHLDYWPGCAPWQYPDHWLAALCEGCHAEKTASAAEDRVANLSVGTEADLHKRVFSLFGRLGAPTDAEELLRELAILDDTLSHIQGSVSTELVLVALRSQGMLTVLSDAARAWQAPLVEGADRASFASHLIRALRGAGGEKE